MQSFTDIPDNLSLTESRPKLLDNDKTILSNSSGSTFPTVGLIVGMTCYRTDLKKSYRLTDLAPSWVLEFDLSGPNAVVYGSSWAGLSGKPSTVAGYGITDIATYAPSLTGAGASGTWGINISGNAATASSANNATVAASCSGNSASATTAAACSGNAATASVAASANALNPANNYSAYSRIWLSISGLSVYSDSSIGFLSTAGGWLFKTDNAGNATATANVTAYSDERLKTNWREFDKDFVKRLAGVQNGIYDRTDIELTQVGTSAQTLRPVMPHAVLESEDGTLSVAYGNAAMASSVELAKYVVALEERITQLEGK